MKKVKAEIITIGNEILAGWTLNTNAHWIAQQLSDIGLAVEWITTTSDTEDEINASLDNASGRADVVLCTGGLGPTPDDITKKAISKFFKCQMVLHQETLDHVLKLFESRNINMPEINRNQALVPEKAQVLHNPLGTAPGLLFEEDHKLYFFMPGVPREMHRIIQSYVLPHIKESFKLLELRTYLLRTTGIAESRLFEKLEATLNEHPDVSVSFLPKITGVDIKLKVAEKPTSEFENAKRLIHQIDKIAEKYIYTHEEQELSDIIGALLLERKPSLAIAESFTGGLISDWITNTPGSSAYFLGSVIAYSDESKIRELGVNQQSLKKYGAVSEEVAREMVQGVQRLYQTEYAIASTGIAGPGGATETKPVGLCFLSATSGKKCVVKKFHFGKDRQTNKERGAMAGLELLRRLILNI